LAELDLNGKRQFEGNNPTTLSKRSGQREPIASPGKETAASDDGTDGKRLSCGFASAFITNRAAHRSCLPIERALGQADVSSERKSVSLRSPRSA